MALSGNKGEWSEIYTLFKLLGEGKVHAGDANMNKLDIYYPIINIIREESKRYEYMPNVQKNIVVINEDGEELTRISMDRFMKESASLLKKIKEPEGFSGEDPATESFMHSIGCTRLKASSKDKADIHIVIHDLRTNMTPLLGFSIKSQLGSASTLFNASKATNILFKVQGKALSDEEIEQINSNKEHNSRMVALLSAGCHLKYYDVENETFKNNLLFLDSRMPEFMAECLCLSDMPGTTNDVAKIVETISERNPFNFSGNNKTAFYEFKMKVFLLGVALGMMPTKEWTGRYEANGGYIVVRKDGEIVCYHFYNRNDVEDYLFANTRFERASRSRHDFGYVFRAEDNNVYMRLNLQIRFKK